MQLDFLFTPFKRAGQTKDVLQIGSQVIPIHFVRNRKARRYIIRVQPDGSIRATVPRIGSIKAARTFAARNTAWIAYQLKQRQAHPARSTLWQHGTEILYRGEKVQLSVTLNQHGQIVQFGDQTLPAPHPLNLRPAIERQLRKLATRIIHRQAIREASP